MRGEDITGKKFNRLTVLQKTTQKQGTSYLWECQCDCGAITYATKTALERNHKKSCGCLHTEQRSNLGKSKKKNLAGQTIGDLLVLESTSDRKNGRVIWCCQCSCGRIIYRSSDELNRGRLNCGCKNINSFGEQKIKQLLDENGILYTCEKIFDNLKYNSKFLRYDFYVDNKYLIEYDGKQHYIKDFGYGSEIEAIQKRDQIKNQYALQYKIPLIRIPYTLYNNLTISDLLLESTKYLVKE